MTSGRSCSKNSIATALALAALIVVFGPVSGARFNPVVTLADWWLHRRDARWRVHEVGGYVAAQTIGAVGGAVLANLMFALPPVTWSSTDRSTPHLWLGELVATAGLILLIFALVHTDRTTLAPAAVGAYIGAAYWFSSSTAFANPAVTIARSFTDTFTGIGPTATLGFIGAQLAGAIVGLAALAVVYPSPVVAPAAPEHVDLVEAGDLP
jgi:arsenate reductase